MNVAILGATKGIGRSLARACAERGDRLVLLGRNLEDLQRSASDLEIRGAQRPVGTIVCDLHRPDEFSQALDDADRLLDPLETVAITSGKFSTQEEMEQDGKLTADILSVNFTNTIMFCELARQRLLVHGGGTLCVFSSVAGDRGRKSVILYGAAKAGLSHYLEGLDHKFRAAGLRTICVKPGFVKTSMTAGLTAPPFAVGPDPVARRVLKAIDHGTPVVYAPWIWQWVMLLIRYLPRFVMRKISF